MTRLRRHTIHRARVRQKMLLARLIHDADMGDVNDHVPRCDDPEDPEPFTWFGGTLYDDDDGMHQT